ncbi:MAG: polysaccharide pyruvyl transferase family protein [Caenispirillum sp.]|nr:polysaccharide pyruvyl transferase family protein [Caenispirillum sp.]
MIDEPRALRIGLLWHSLRNENLGVGALTIAQIALLRKAAARAGRSVLFHVIGPDGRLHYPPADVPVEESLVGGWRDFLPGSPLWRTIASCDIVFDNGAGDSFTDLYGWRRFWRLALSKEVALATRTPLVLSPQTIGPFRQGYAIREAKRLVKRSEEVFARDAESVDALAQLGRPGAPQTVDVAFRLPFERPQPVNDGTIRFGLNVSGLMLSGGYTGRNQFGLACDYPQFVDALIGMLQQIPQVKVVLVPHVVPEHMPVEDDYAASQRLAQKFPGVEVAPRFRSPSEAKSYISGLDILAGSRMHATIAAVSSGVAVIPLAYSRKFRGVFNSVDYPLIGDVTSQGERELLDLCRAAVDRREELRVAAVRSNGIAQQRLDVYEDYLAERLARFPVPAGAPQPVPA